MLGVSHLAGLHARGGSNNVQSYTVTISSDTDRFNLRTTLLAAPHNWNGTDPVSVIVNVNTGVDVYSTVAGTAAFSTGSIPADSALRLNNAGSILGRGGNGGQGGDPCSDNDAAGSDGSDAISLGYPLTINNADGNIWAGGGGGGGGGAGNAFSGGESPSCTGGAGGGGGGGAGRNAGSGGSAGSGASVGNAGTETAGGTGGAGQSGSPSGAAGGAGGGPGLPGTAGANSTLTGGATGAAGRSVRLNGHSVTWTAGFNSSQVRGIVL